MMRRYLAVLAAAVSLSFHAQAADVSFDFEGYTVSFNGVSQSDFSSSSYAPLIYLARNYTEIDGVRTDGPELIYGNWNEFTYGASLPGVESSDGGYNSESRVFTYEVKAKSGWQLSYVNARGDFSSPYGSGGAPALSTPTAVISAVGGSAFSTQEYGYGSDESGTLISSFYQEAYGSLLENKTTPIPGGKKVEFFLTPYAPLLTEVAGSTTLEIAAISYPYSSTSVGQGSGNFKLEVFAIRNVSPVPEPASYAMMLVGLGALACMARRRNKKLSAA